MNILLVHNYYQIRGGEDAVFENEKQLLLSHGHQVFTYTRNNIELNSMGPLRKMNALFESRFSKRTYREILEILRRHSIDIVHVHNTLALVSPSVFYAAKKCGVPVVNTLHNFRLICPNGLFFRDGHICEECANGNLKAAIKHRCYRNSLFATWWLERSLKRQRKTGILRYNHYICLSDFNKQKLLECSTRQGDFIDPKKVFVKPNFIPTQGTQAKPSVSRGKDFIFVGRLEIIKGIETLLSAWKRVEGTVEGDLILCGTGPMEQAAKEFVAANELKRVRFLGAVEHERVLNLMSNSRALILPTICYEGFPMTIIESLSVGTPVIVSDFGNAGAIVDEQIGVKFEKGSAEKLAAVIASFDRETQFERARLLQIYENRFSASANYDRLIEIYESALKKEEK